MEAIIAFGDHGHGHTHGVVDPTIATTQRGIWAIKWSFVILAATAALAAGRRATSRAASRCSPTPSTTSATPDGDPALDRVRARAAEARRRPSPMAMGRVEDLAGIVIVLIILFSAIVAGYQSIDRLILRSRYVHLGWLAAAGVIGFLGNEAVAVFRIRIGRRDQQRGAHRRRLPCPHRRANQPRSGPRRDRRVAGVSARRPDRRPPDHRSRSSASSGSPAKAVLTRMLDGVEPRVTSKLRHVAEHTKGVQHVEQVRARWLGHRLYGEMTLAVDPALSATDVGKLADDIRNHARGHLAALESLHVETVPASGRERPKHHPQAEHQHHH